MIFIRVSAGVWAGDPSVLIGLTLAMLRGQVEMVFACFIESPKIRLRYYLPMGCLRHSIMRFSSDKRKTGHCPFRHEAKRSSAWLLFGD